MFCLWWLLWMSGVDGKYQSYSCLLSVSLRFLLTGNDLGLAFEIPQHMKNQPFFASCVLKVSYNINIKVENKPTGATFTPYNFPSPYLCNRMQSWSSTLGEKTLNMHLRVGLLPWTRRRRVTQSNLLRQVCGCNLVSGAARKCTERRRKHSNVIVNITLL